jgi:excinuclease ABC subunit C
VDPQKGLRDLARKLELDAPPKRIEGLDLANLAGREAAGSIVTFIDGKPAKGFYRRYQIKTAPGNNDYAQMAEVVSRRLKRLAANDEPGPDLLLLDGGAGHLAAAAAAIAKAPLSARPKAFCSLAKREETVHLPSGRTLKLPRTSAALKILQHVRDEAHRFAGQYHRKLRDRQSLPAGTSTAKGRKKK